MVIVFPFASSKRSIVLISIIIVRPKVIMSRKMKVTNRPDQIGIVVNPTQL